MYPSIVLIFVMDVVKVIRERDFNPFSVFPNFYQFYRIRNIAYINPLVELLNRPLTIHPKSHISHTALSSYSPSSSLSIYLQG